LFVASDRTLVWAMFMFVSSDRTWPPCASEPLTSAQGRPLVIGPFIWAWIDDQRQRSFVTGTRADRPASRITKTSEAVCVQDAVSEWPSAARRRFRGGYHGV
jgi:hypothetical protein